VVLLANFLLRATVILVGVGLALLLSGSLRNTVSLTYPERRPILMSHRIWLAPAFLFLAAAIAATSIGRFKQREWSCWLASAQAGPPQVLG
jgi:hypothetical protein